MNVQAIATEAPASDAGIEPIDFRKLDKSDCGGRLPNDIHEWYARLVFESKMTKAEVLTILVDRAFGVDPAGHGIDAEAQKRFDSALVRLTKQLQAATSTDPS